MPRYFFEVYDGRSSHDEFGTVLNDGDAAKREAMRRANILLRVTRHALATKSQSWRMTVTDEQGETVCRVDAAPGVLAIY